MNFKALLGKVSKIVGALGISTFMYSKMLAILFRLKSMTAIRAYEYYRFISMITFIKELTTDLAL